MKVGILAGVYHPETGGSATYLRRLREDLRAAGHGVRVVCFGDTGSEPGVIRVSRRIPIPLRLGIFGYAAARWLSDADVWYVNEYGLVETLLRPIYRKPMVMKIIGDWAWESAVNRGVVSVRPPRLGEEPDPLFRFQAERHPPRVGVRKLIRTLCATAMDRIIVPSRFLGEVVRRWGVPPERISIIHNGMALEPRDASLPSREATLIVTAARLVRWKGIDHLLCALAILIRSIPGVRLEILGDGPEREDLERLCAQLGLRDHVTFLGHVSRDAVRRRMAAATVFALPSAYEGLPHVLLEALAMGCPVVAAAAGGTPEVVTDGIDGLLVPFGDADALAGALLRVLSEPGLADRLATNGLERSMDAFSWEATSRAAIAILADLAGPPGSRPRPTDRAWGP